MRTSNNVWINPIAVIHLFTKYVQSRISLPEDLSQLVKVRGFRPTVEAWSAAMYLLALDKRQSDVKHFLQQNPEDPPDFFGLDLFKESGYIRGYFRGIEVFEYVPETPLSLEEEISKKVKKAYGKTTILVCHIRKTYENTVGQIHDAVAKLNPHNEVWIIGGSEKNSGSPNLVSQVYPNMEGYLVDIADVMLLSPKPAFIEGTTGKSTDFLFEPTGKTLLLTPDFKLSE